MCKTVFFGKDQNLIKETNCLTTNKSKRHCSCAQAAQTGGSAWIVSGQKVAICPIKCPLITSTKLMTTFKLGRWSYIITAINKITNLINIIKIMRTPNEKITASEKQLCLNLHNKKIDMMDVNCRKTKYWSLSILLLGCVFVCVFISIIYSSYRDRHAYANVSAHTPKESYWLLC